MNLFPPDHPIALELGVDLNKIGMIVSSGFAHQGPLDVPGSILVMGHYTGSISTPGTLYLAPGATLSGGGNVGAAVIAGQVAGPPLHCRGALTLKDGAELSSQSVEYGEIDFEGTTVKINCLLQRRDFGDEEPVPVTFVVERYAPQAARPAPAPAPAPVVVAPVRVAVVAPVPAPQVLPAPVPAVAPVVARKPDAALAQPLSDGQPMSPMRPAIVAPFINPRRRAGE